MLVDLIQFTIDLVSSNRGGAVFETELREELDNSTNYVDEDARALSVVAARFLDVLCDEDAE